jgi:hypothetical protein
MKRIFIVLLLFIFVLTGCAAKLGVKSISSEKQSVYVGEAVKLTVVLKGSPKLVSRVIATVREAPEFSFPLNDEGKSGDVKAGDNIWSYALEVPYEADPGNYHLDISVRDKDGKELVVEGREKYSTGRSGTIEVNVK